MAVVETYINNLLVGEVIQRSNLAVVPLFAQTHPTVDYLLLDEALDSGDLRVSEVSAKGVVSRLRVETTPTSKVLILGGEELAGAKQNRIVNVTILVAEESTITVPVSCVEQGRWTSGSSHFRSEQKMATSSMRADITQTITTTLPSERHYDTDQRAIWNHIDAHSRLRGVCSPTGAMSDIYDSDAAQLNHFLEMQPLDDQVGAVFIINGVVVGLESFANTHTLQTVYRKLMKSYAMDALLQNGRAYGGRDSRRDAMAFLLEAREATVDEDASPGLGVNIRLESPYLTGLALAWGESLLHLSVFARREYR